MYGNEVAALFTAILTRPERPSAINPPKKRKKKKRKKADRTTYPDTSETRPNDHSKSSSTARDHFPSLHSILKIIPRRGVTIHIELTPHLSSVPQTSL